MIHSIGMRFATKGRSCYNRSMNATSDWPTEYAARRFQETLGRASTDAQRRRLMSLFALGKDVYASNCTGASIVAQFRRYVETGDSAKIGRALYVFSHATGGGFSDIAHYDLEGYRRSYSHPALYVECVVLAAWPAWPESYREHPEGYHCATVYRDGMTSGDVVHAIVKIALEQRDRLIADLQAQRDAADLAEAQRLADRLGMRLVAWPRGMEMRPE